MAPGDLATWVGAMGSIGALVAAMIAVRFTHRLFLIELARDKKLEEDRAELENERRRLQASRVSSWVTLKLTPSDSRSAFLALSVRNASDLPIYSLYFQVADSSGRQLFTESLPVLPPDDAPLELPQTVECDIRFASDPSLLQGVAVDFRFVDAAGRHWTRRANGALEAIPGDSTLLASFARPESVGKPVLPPNSERFALRRE